MSVLASKAPCLVGYKVQGFTLIELMVMIAIMAILATIAVPGFSGWLGDNRVKKQAFELFADIKDARALARSGSDTVDNDSSNIAYKSRTATQGQGVVYTMPALSSGLTLTARNSAQNTFCFNKMGRLFESDCMTPYAGGSYDVEGHATYRITIESSGMVRTPVRQ